MALHAWAEGYAEEEAIKQLRSLPASRKEVLGGVAVRRRDIPDYFTEDFGRALRIWSDYKRFGLPYAGGWARQPAPLIAIIRTFENEFAAWQKTKQTPKGNVPRGGRIKK